jgi:hypothetical protein
MLAGWKEGVVPCPNGIANPESRPSCSDSRWMSRYGTCSCRRSGAGGGPRSAPIRGVSAEAVREAPSCSSRSGSRSRNARSRSRRATPTTSSRSGSPRRATRATRTSGSAGAGSASTSLSRPAARCTSSRAGSTPRLPGRARLAAPLLAAANRDVGAGGRCWSRPGLPGGLPVGVQIVGPPAGEALLSSLPCSSRPHGPGQTGARSPPPERLPPLVRPRRPPAWR